MAKWKILHWALFCNWPIWDEVGLSTMLGFAMKYLVPVVNITSRAGSETAEEVVKTDCLQ